jgi:hypothetical protein
MGRLIIVKNNSSICRFSYGLSAILPSGCWQERLIFPFIATDRQDCHDACIPSVKPVKSRDWEWILEKAAVSLSREEQALPLDTFIIDI